MSDRDRLHQPGSQPPGSQPPGSQPPGSQPPGHQAPGDRTRLGQGLPDYHNPLSGVGGAAPASSALTLRLVLAVCGLVLATAGAVVLAAISVPVGFVILLALIALTAVVDIVVILRRKRRGEPG